MSGLYWGENGARLRSYKLTAGSASRTVMRIELEISSEWDLASLVHQLAEIEQEQGKIEKAAREAERATKAAAAEARRAEKAATREASKALRSRRSAPALERPQELLRLTYRGD
ncbi:hypothetical protein [Segnochrobactrum spirostomi]|uniref:Uncharacterized protein n=1 Tax=Segnochrobactrum spirostomi TaxID=2608987 RepID=A0A6A7Y4K1_9HYPH|nr:hypothetical protein [Segnochrobactrum spirostomi]MQT13666.1 hypothetical protein [Segnochrobactrum spirostomi]